MNLTYTIVDVPGWGYGYRIESDDGTVRIFQDTKPGIPGNVRMTREDAEQFAQQKLAEIMPT